MGLLLLRGLRGLRVHVGSCAATSILSNTVATADSDTGEEDLVQVVARCESASEGNVAVLAFKHPEVEAQTAVDPQELTPGHDGKTLDNIIAVDFSMVLEVKH